MWSFWEINTWRLKLINIQVWFVMINQFVVTFNSKRNPTQNSSRIHTKMQKILHKQYVKNAIQKWDQINPIQNSQKDNIEAQTASTITLHRHHNSHWTTERTHTNLQIYYTDLTRTHILHIYTRQKTHTDPK